LAATRTITRIEIQKGKKNRVSIFLDEAFAFGLDQDVLIQSGIATGDQLTEEQVLAVTALEERHSAKRKALRLLAVRSRSRKELLDKLQMAKFSAAAVAWAVAEMERLQLIDNVEFARSFSQNRMVTRPVGKIVLQHELKQKGLSPAEISQGLEKAYENLTETQVARSLAEKRKKNYRHLEEDKAKKRVADFLLRRGFNWDLVSEILDHWDQF
jgi:regulatory protein